MREANEAKSAQKEVFVKYPILFMIFFILAVCPNQITSADENPTPLETQAQDILNKFSGEPAISDVQEAAIRYAEVHPGKIKEWRDAAKKKALLPKVSFGLDRNSTDLWHWESGSTAIGQSGDDLLRRGHDSVDWDVTMTWDMGELIWNSDQTSIDTRSKLMVELRDDIVNEVTRIYFERRRLQVELLTFPPGDLKPRLEKELRMQELTADINALTGGYFAKHTL